MEEDINPLASPPVYKADQVILGVELLYTIVGMEEAKTYLKSWQWLERWKHDIAIRTIEAIYEWLAEGKPKTNRRLIIITKRNRE